MVLNKMKDIKKSSGFTIVELLIVIVVIGILAAITIVAYSGITARANTTKSQTNAVQAQKVAEAFNADNSRYPGTLAEFGTGVTAKLPAGVTVSGTSPVVGTPAPIWYQYCGASAVPGVAGALGGKLVYWDYTTGAPSTNIIYVGSGAATLVPATCNTWVSAA